MYVGRFPAAPQQLRAAESDLCPAGLEEQPPERSPDCDFWGVESCVTSATHITVPPHLKQPRRPSLAARWGTHW